MPRPSPWLNSLRVIFLTPVKLNMIRNARTKRRSSDDVEKNHELSLGASLIWHCPRVFINRNVVPHRNVANRSIPAALAEFCTLNTNTAPCYPSPAGKGNKVEIVRMGMGQMGVFAINRLLLADAYAKNDFLLMLK